jgi:solute carrier family 25 protein 39/40
MTAKEDYYYEQIITPLVGGTVARLFATMVTSPLELIRTRQAGNVGAGGMVSEFRSILRSSNSGLNNSLYSVYRGLLPTLWRDVPFSAIYWVGVETLKKELFQRKTHGKQYDEPSSLFVTVYQSFASGVLSGTIAAACTTPFDVLKTRSQVALTYVSSPEKTKNVYHIPSLLCDHQGQEMIYPRERNILYQLRYIAKSEGISALWRGNVARMLKIGPACAIMLSSYEYAKFMFLTVQ